MMMPQFCFIIFFSFSVHLSCSNPQSSSVYEVLKSHELPMGLLPKGIKEFSIDDSGKFQVHLPEACNAKFENELHYDQNISGTLTVGKINDVTGISAQDLFLWFPVKEIRVDVPSSGLIYFDVGVAYKQFAQSSFETPRDCLALQLLDVQYHNTILQILSGKFDYQLRHKDLAVDI